MTNNSGLLSLPDDIFCEVFNLLDAKALRSCSLTCKALSYLTKPILHRTLHLICPPAVWLRPKVPGRWHELEGLPILGERGLLQHTRHISITLVHNPLFPHDFDPHIRHLRTLTNLRSLKARSLDTPSFIPKMEEYFGTFLRSLQSLELAFPRGDTEQIFCFICQFWNLRNLKIRSFAGRANSVHNDSPRFDTETSPPLDGTLDLELGMDVGPGSGSTDAQLILKNLVTLPSGLKFRTLKLSKCTGSNLQPLVDACAPALECMEFTGQWSGTPFHCRGNHPKLIGFGYQALPPVLRSVSSDTPRSDDLKST